MPPSLFMNFTFHEKYLQIDDSYLSNDWFSVNIPNEIKYLNQRIPENINKNMNLPFYEKHAKIYP